ncbi:hypothetical protein GEMRC1_013925 [Eukaryota sp. GEM-RC1]
MVAWMLFCLQDRSKETEEFFLVLSFFANIDTIEGQQPLSFSSTTFLNHLISIAPTCYVFCWLFSCLIHSFQCNSITEDEFGEILLSVSMEQMLKSFFCQFLKNQVLKLIEPLSHNDGVIVKFKGSLLFPLFVASSIIPNDPVRKLLVTESVVIEKPRSSKDSSSNNNGDQIVTVNYGHFSESYANHPKLSGIDQTKKTIELDIGNCMATFFFSWVHEEPITLNDVSSSLCSKISNFCESYNLWQFYLTIVDTICENRLIDPRVLGSCVTYFRPPSSIEKFTFLKKILCFALQVFSDDSQLETFLQSLRISINDPDDTSLPFLWEYHNQNTSSSFNSFRSQTVSLRSYLNAILNNDEELVVSYLCDEILSNRYYEFLPLVFPKLSQSRQREVIEQICFSSSVQKVFELTEFRDLFVSLIQSSDGAFYQDLITELKFNIDENNFNSEQRNVLAESYILKNLDYLFSFELNGNSGEYTLVTKVLTMVLPWLDSSQCLDVVAYAMTNFSPINSSPYYNGIFDCLDLLKIPKPTNPSWKLLYAKFLANSSQHSCDSHLFKVTNHLYDQTLSKTELQSRFFLSELLPKIPKQVLLSECSAFKCLKDIVTSNDKGDYEGFSISSPRLLMQVNSEVVIGRLIHQPNRSRQPKGSRQSRSTFSFFSVNPSSTVVTSWKRDSSFKELHYIPSQSTLMMIDNGAHYTSFRVLDKPSTTGKPVTTVTGVTRIEVL